MKLEIKCQGRIWYEHTRNLCAFTVREWGMVKRKNQYATIYLFNDGSAFIVYKSNECAYREKRGNMMARRTLFGTR
jgi:hypothetical protein